MPKGQRQRPRPAPPFEQAKRRLLKVGHVLAPSVLAGLPSAIAMMSRSELTLRENSVPTMRQEMNQTCYPKVLQVAQFLPIRSPPEGQNVTHGCIGAIPADNFITLHGRAAGPSSVAARATRALGVDGDGLSVADTLLHDGLQCVANRRRRRIFAFELDAVLLREGAADVITSTEGWYSSWHGGYLRRYDGGAEHSGGYEKRNLSAGTPDLMVATQDMRGWRQICISIPTAFYVVLAALFMASDWPRMD
ncbi:hypothetical protein J3R83DRAFT_8994 [Lanmaoa asiatica]|nr:hypothetical protein J3R83DRAFT_8994 [Lanmaoa asiatica]